MRFQYTPWAAAPHAFMISIHLRYWSRKFSWKVATHSKPYWCKGGGWLIMVDISYTTLHKQTGEGGSGG